MSDQLFPPLVIIGGGGHASVLTDILLRQKREIVAVVSPDNLSLRKVFSGIPQIKRDEDVIRFCPTEVKLVMGIGILPKSDLRERVTKYFGELGYHFESVIADSVMLSPFAQLGEGVQLLENAKIQTGAIVGAFSIVNSGALVEHDCQIGPHNHIAPMATLCGQVNTGKNTYIGASATVIQSVTLGDCVIVGAGATVTQSLDDRSICYPSRSIIEPY